MRDRIYQKSESGSVFVELLWTVPLFIAGIVLIALVGIHLNARSALQDSATQALSLASSRGFSPQLSEDLLPNINKFLEDPSHLPEIRHLLVSLNQSRLTDDEILVAYETALGGVPLDKLNSSQLLALIYVNQALALASLGEAVFPCTANEFTGGCLTCSFNPPAIAGGQPTQPTLTLDPLADLVKIPSTGYGEAQSRSTRQRLEMWCGYRPKNRLLEVLSGIARAFGVPLEPSLGQIKAHSAVDAFAGF